MKKNEIENKAREDGGTMQSYISQKKVTECPTARMLFDQIPTEYEGTRHLTLRVKCGKE